MSALSGRIIAFILAFATLGAQFVCGCPDLAARRSTHSIAMTKECSSGGNCCRKLTTEAPGRTPAPEPCDRCNLVHHADQMLPRDSDGYSVAPILLAAPFEMPPTLAPVECSTRVSIVGATDVPIPPLLQDLFHTQSLLLI